MKSLNDKIRSSILGLAIGDALGYPVQFKSRDYLKANPVMDMIPCEDFNGLTGIWSDDTSLSLCLLENLKRGINYEEIANSMLRWFDEGYMTPFGRSFDAGFTTAEGIGNIRTKKIPAVKCGICTEEANGNGSLMRILPLAFYVKDKAFTDRISIIKDISSITHGHWKSVVSCIILIEFAIELINGFDLKQAYINSTNRRKDKQADITNLFGNSDMNILEYEETFSKILSLELAELPENQIKSSGYVIDSLESALWSLLSTNSFEKAVLTAVNLGGDCDTIGSITGGLAGLYYGYDKIHTRWIEKLQGNIIKSIVNLTK